MKPGYYTNAKEHVMSYQVWQTLKLKDVQAIIGPLAKDKK